MDGVAVTTEHVDLSRFRSAAGALAALVLIWASVGFAQAQSNSAAPSAASAPSGAPATLPPQPPPLQLGGQIGNQVGGQVPNQTPSQASGQAPSQAPAQGSSEPANQAASLPAAPDQKRGFLNDLGRWWNDSIADFNAKMKEQQAKLEEFNRQQTAAAKDATQAMKNAADAMFTPAKVIEVQQLCPVAGNGAPDCATAATNVCKAKGFSDGHPMDIRTAERCKASLWVSGEVPNAADCPVETVLLRVACQP